MPTSSKRRTSSSFSSTPTRSSTGSFSTSAATSSPSSSLQSNDPPLRRSTRITKAKINESVSTSSPVLKTKDFAATPSPSLKNKRKKELSIEPRPTRLNSDWLAGLSSQSTLSSSSSSSSSSSLSNLSNSSLKRSSSTLIPEVVINIKPSSSSSSSSSSSLSSRRTSDRLKKAQYISLSPLLKVTPFKSSSPSLSTSSTPSPSLKRNQRLRASKKITKVGRPKKLFTEFTPSTPSDTEVGTVSTTAKKNITSRHTDENELSLWNSLQSSDISIKVLVRDWVDACKLDPSAALLNLINTIVQASGCSKLLNSSQFEDQDAVTDYLEELQYYPLESSTYLLINKSTSAKVTRKHLFYFFTLLLESYQDIVFDDEILEILCSWIVAMSSSKSRPFRHTATSLALHVCTCLCSLAIQENRYAAMAKEALMVLFDSVFVHRCKDVAPLIRRECLLSLVQWLTIAPGLLLEDLRVRYFGWALNDQDSSVRLTSLNCLVQIYKHPTLQCGMQRFSEKFKPRFIEMALQELEKSVQLAATHVLALMYPLGYLETEDVSQLSKLAFQLPSPHLLSIFEKEFTGYDWTAFAAFLLDLLIQVYGDEVGPNADHAIFFFMQHYALPLHKDLNSLVTLLKRTDALVPNDLILCYCLLAIAKLHPDRLQPYLSQLSQVIEKYKSEYEALRCFVEMIQACQTYWTSSTALTNVLVSCLDFFHSQFLQSTHPGFLRAVSVLYHTFLQQPDLQPMLAPKFTYLKEHTHVEAHPQGFLALLKRFPMPLDVMNLDSSEVSMQLYFLHCLWNKETDPLFLSKALKVLKSSTEEIWMANLLMEYHIAFQLHVSDEASILLDTYFALYPEACIDQFSKLLISRLVDMEYLASVFPLYTHTSKYLDTIIERGLIPLLQSLDVTLVHALCLTSFQKLTSDSIATKLSTLFFKMYQHQRWTPYTLLQRAFQWSVDRNQWTFIYSLKEWIQLLSIEEAQALEAQFQSHPLAFTTFQPFFQKKIHGHVRKRKALETKEKKRGTKSNVGFTGRESRESSDESLSDTEVRPRTRSRAMVEANRKEEQEEEEEEEQASDTEEDDTNEEGKNRTRKEPSTRTSTRLSSTGTILKPSKLSEVLKSSSLFSELSEETIEAAMSVDEEFTASPPVKRRRRY